jgi:hypothetical protein
MTQNILKEWLKYDKNTGIFTRIKINPMDTKNSIGDEVAKNIRNGYLRIRICGKLYSSHRLAWLYEYGVEPTLTIDHKDRNKLNNKIDNLRDVSSSINKINQKTNKRNVSGKTGVYKCSRSGKYVATITPPNKKRIRLGVFSDISSAIIAREEAEDKYH